MVALLVEQHDASEEVLTEATVVVVVVVVVALALPRVLSADLVHQQE